MAVVTTRSTPLLIAPVQTMNKSFQNERSQIQEQITNLETRRILATGLLNNTKRKHILNEMALVEGKIKDFDNKILDRLQGQVAPDNMANMLNDVLQNNQHLELIRIHNIPAQPLERESGTTNKKTIKGKPQSSAGDSENQASVGLFMHPLEIELSGRYLDIIHYLETLEQLEWKISWDQVTIDVLEYPNVKVKIRVHTFSLKDGWLSV
ncbi:MAG: hypothetical protein KZQ67_16160 [gamma proteobacterium symbiont of Bathyaustriella thionipta]|nr:hypothetical protein [gamma proteobacterium symbiont of Bathyaustriella thionipta]